MTSEDVIHSFFVPGFRIKKDAVPGRYTTQLVPGDEDRAAITSSAPSTAAREHSGMIGSVMVMEPAEFQAWLAGGAGGDSLAAAGEKLFQELGCVTCHRADASGARPALEGLFGRPVPLASGETVVADEDYLRESILNPAGEGRRRLSADHADLPGAGQRGGAHAAHRVHQVAPSPAGCGRSSGRAGGTRRGAGARRAEARPTRRPSRDAPPSRTREAPPRARRTTT